MPVLLCLAIAFNYTLLFPRQCIQLSFHRGKLKTLHWYLLRQVIATMLMTALVFTFVLLLVNVLREILPLLVNRQVPIGLVWEAFLLLIPFVLVFALPMGMLTATLLVFGRFSADQELTAARAGGISLVSLITPVLILSLLLCAISAPITLEVAPHCRVAYVNLRDKLRNAAIEKFNFPEGQPVKDSSGWVFWVGKNRNRELENIRIWSFENETNLQATIHAATGRLEPDVANKKLMIQLFTVQLEVFGTNLNSTPVPMEATTIEFNLGGTNKFKPPSLSDMSFTELRQELNRLENAANAPLQPGKLSPAELEAQRRAMKKHLPELTEPIRVFLHWQVAFSFACFGFTLVGIPLGIRVHRRETNIGIAIALGLVLLYYGIMITGRAFNNRPELAPHLMVWMPNFLFQAVGAVLLWRANRR
jgi:lipopolysaccharide export system permease protein